MDLTDIAIPAGASGATLVLVGMVRYAVPSLSRTVRHWIKGRAQSAQMAADLAIEREKEHGLAEKRLLDRVEALDRRLDASRDEMAKARREDREECQRLREEDRKLCDRDIAAVRSDLSGEIEGLKRTLSMRDEDVTQRVEVAVAEVRAEVRRSLSPPGGTVIPAPMRKAQKDNE